MPRRTYRWWLLLLLFGGRNPKDPPGRFGSLTATEVLGVLGAVHGGAMAFLVILGSVLKSADAESFEFSPSRTIKVRYRPP